MHPSPQPEPAPRLIPNHGGYRRLRSFHAAQAVYDATVVFCDRFIDTRSRTHDQMVQAARSGVRNIEEGSAASATSKKTELKLTNVARASLEELLRDCEDFLRHRHLPLWDKDSPQARRTRAALVATQNRLSDRSDRSDRSDKSDKSDKVAFRPLGPEPPSRPIVAVWLRGRERSTASHNCIEIVRSLLQGS